MGGGTCCRCTNVHRPRLLPSPITFIHTEFPRLTQRNPLRRAIGVELEIAGFRRPSREALAKLYNACQRWNANIGTDGTVPDGVEIRLAPSAGNAFVRQVYDIVGAIREANGFVTERAGLHVHVDMRDVATTGTQMAQLLNAWPLVEDVFYETVKPEREGNPYCRKWSVHYANRGPGPDAVNRYSFDNVIAVTRRYSGLNIHALRAHRTVEFRLHHGTVNRRSIVAWGLLCASFVDAVVTTQHYDAMLQYINDHGPKAFLQAIAPTRDAKRYIGRGHLNDELRRAA